MKTVPAVLFLVGAGLSLYLLAGTQRVAVSATPSAPAATGPAAAVPAVAASTAAPVACPAQPAVPAAPAPSPIHISYPWENECFPTMPSTFVFGRVDSTGTLTINGENVPVHPGGGFIAMVKLSTGTFPIEAALTVDGTTYRAVRTVTVAEPPKAAPATPLTIESVSPEGDLELAPGDEVVVTCKASPGMEASFTVDKVEGKFPMFETTAAPGGIYRGVYVAEQGDKLKRTKLRVTVADKARKKKLAKYAAGTLSWFAGRIPVIGEISAENAILTAAPALGAGDRAGYTLFLPKGTNLQLTGRRGSELRVRLSATREAWVNGNDVCLLPQGTPRPRAVAGSVNVTGSGRCMQVRLPLGKRLPFDVRPDADGKFIDVSVYGASSNTDWIEYRSSGVVTGVQWSQDDADTYRLRVRTGAPWWGYDARYEGTTFVLELKAPPPPAKAGKPLEGITVAVDPGHTPDTGAVGPTGLMEKDANLAIACALRDKLTAQGAKVFMTHQGEGIALLARTKAAWQAGADIFVSVHNNSLPDGQNPFAKNGYGVYYYHPSSLPLAKEVHDAYGESFGVRNATYTLRDDGLYYGNLAVTRSTLMPSILTETAFVIIPREEAFLKDPDFRGQAADAIARGVRRYVEATRGVLPAEPQTAAKRKRRSLLPLR